MQRSALMMMLVLAWGLQAPAAVAAPAADLQIRAADILGSGVFRTKSQARHTGFTKSTMAADRVTGVEFTEITNEIPGVLGTNFGFEYQINSNPRGKDIEIRSVVIFPEGGLKKPGGRVYEKSVQRQTVKIGRKSLHGYGFDEPWEIVPGDWIFEIWYKNARVIKKTFTVVAVPEAGPETAPEVAPEGDASEP